MTRGTLGRAGAEAVILAGGFGTRMLPLTERRPKHLLEVGGVPFLEHQLTKLAAVGIEHVVLATSYRAALFRPVLGDGERYGVRLSYVTEDQPRGTGGALRNVASALDGDPDHAVVVLNGDVLSGHDIGAQLTGYAERRGGRAVEVSLHLIEVPDPRAFGSVPTDGAGRVTGFLEKSEVPVSHQVNAGCYVMRRALFDLIPPDRVISVEREVFPALIADDALVVGYLEPGAHWRDVGSPAALVAASRDVVLGYAATPAVVPPRDGVLKEPSADVRGTLTNGASVLAGASIGPGSLVDGSVVMAGAVVGAGAVVVDSVIGPGAVLGDDVVLTGAAVGDDARVGAGARPPAGTRVGCGAVWHRNADA